MMIVAVSPYHLTSREPPAMASLLLAGRVVTFVPGPAEATLDAVAGAAARQPLFHSFMESWRWTIPLWREGVIVSGLEGEDAGEDIRAARRAMQEGEGDLAPLRALAGEDPFEGDERHLAVIARDVLRGGPDPGVSVPVAAGLDAFACRHGLVVARADPSSVAQRCEREMGRGHYAVALPVLLQASAARLLMAREVLSDSLAVLRGALGGGFETPEPVRAAAQRYGADFERARPFLLAPEEDDELPRVVEGAVTLSAMELPLDAVLRSSAAAALETAGMRARGSGVVADASMVRTMLVKALGRRGTA